MKETPPLAVRAVLTASSLQSPVLCFLVVMSSLQEFKVQTSLYDAQYGRGGGANVVVETRSGTAQLHGNAYYFGRNEALNANNFLRMRQEYREEYFAATNPVAL